MFPLLLLLPLLPSHFNLSLSPFSLAFYLSLSFNKRFAFSSRPRAFSSLSLSRVRASLSGPRLFSLFLSYSRASAAFFHLHLACANFFWLLPLLCACLFSSRHRRRYYHASLFSFNSSGKIRNGSHFELPDTQSFR